MQTALHREIILLMTSKGTGKSTSIKWLYNCVKDHYNPEELDSEDCGSSDIRKCIRLHNIIIGFASGGDDQLNVDCNCRFFERNKCSICVTACRTRGPAWNHICKWAEDKEYGISLHDYKIERADNKDQVWKQANKEKVRMMMARVKYLVGCDDKM